MKVKFSHGGNFNNIEKFLKKVESGNMFRSLEKYGNMGVSALASATPKDSGNTANSWTYEITDSGSEYKIQWLNTNVNKGINIAIILQYGHGTGTGGYVRGIDYINPAMRPIFERMADEAWKEVAKA